MQKTLLLSILPALKVRFSSSINEYAIGRSQKEPINVQCLGIKCNTYVLKRPDNIIRDYKKYGVPSIYCDAIKCQLQKPKINRAIKPENSLTNARPLLANRLCADYCSDDIGLTEKTYYPFHCIHCNSIVNIRPGTLKKQEHSVWAAFCSDKNECKEQKRILKKKLIKERSSFVRLAKTGQSFVDLFPDSAAIQHKSCNLNLSTLKAQSNKKGLFSCGVCGNPVSIQIGKARGRTEFYCSQNEECRNQKKLSARLKNFATRIMTRGSFASNNPYLIEEWHECISEPSITPEMVPTNATLIVKWKCKANPMHSWEASCDNRTNSPGCPFCTSNISAMQFRFASELEALLGGDVKHSKLYSIAGKKIEIDIAMVLRNKKIGIEVDGYRWHLDKYEKDKLKNSRLKEDDWEVYRFRDNRLESLGSLDDSYNCYVNSASFYKVQWICAIANVVEEITGDRPTNYKDYIAEKKYQELKVYYNSKGNKNKKHILNTTV
jgi:transcription elongation factor Elf1